MNYSNRINWGERMRYNVLAQIPYEELRSMLDGDALVWFSRAFRAKRRGVGTVKTEKAKKWGSREYYVARMVQFMTEPWDHMPVMAELFAWSWSEGERELLDEAVNKITQTVWTWLKENNKELFYKIANETVYVANLYGLSNIRRLE